jgi:hypothetical protein
VKTFRRLFPVLLALLLLSLQQMSYTHALSHLPARSHQSQHGKPLPVEQYCDQCLAFAQIGSASASHVFQVHSDPPPNIAVLSLDVPSLVARDGCVFLSRAPPTFA